jgi:hypothetical protein
MTSNDSSKRETSQEADFLLDELEHPAHVRRILGLASVKTQATRAS